MWLLLFAPAHAAASLFVCDPGDSLASIVGIARRDPGPTVDITVTDSCSIDGIESLEFYPGGYGAVAYTITPEDPSDVFEIPPVTVTGGASLRLERVSIGTTASFSYQSPLDNLVEDDVPGAIYVEGSSLELVDVALTGADGAGIVAIDSELSGTGLTATGFDAYRALYAVASEVPVTLDLDESLFSGNGAGAVWLWAADSSLDATFTAPTFRENGPAGGADLVAMEATIEMSDGMFDGSSAEGFTSVDGAPVYLESTTLTCQRCDFDGTSGGLASSFAAYLDSTDTLRLSEGTFTPANATDRVMHVDSGGSFLGTLLTFEGAGELARFAGTTTIVSSRFYGEGGNTAKHALKLVGTTAVLDGLTMCYYGGNGWGLIGAYGGAVELSDSVIQGLATGSPVIDAIPMVGDVELTVLDNTMVGSDAVLVSGEPISLVFNNNLLAQSAGGLALDAMPSGADLRYNLWFEVDEPIVGGEPGADDVVDEDPRFSDAFDVDMCGSGPWLQRGTPANAKGDPTRGDGYGNDRSDIGAIDYDESGDTGVDTGPSDTGEDTGAVDSGEVDSGAPDDTGALPPSVIAGTLRPCECGGSPSAALVLAAGLLFRRRRA